MCINYVNIVDRISLYFHYGVVFYSNNLYFISSYGEFDFLFQADLAITYKHYWTRVHPSLIKCL